MRSIPPIQTTVANPNSFDITTITQSDLDHLIDALAALRGNDPREDILINQIIRWMQVANGQDPDRE